MRTVLIAEPVKELFGKEHSFLARKDVRLIAAGTFDDLLALQRKSPADLIIALIDLTGMEADRFCADIRNEGRAKRTAIILLHDGSPEAHEAAERCGADAVLRVPDTHGQLLKTAQHLLELPLRESYRVLVSVQVEGASRDKSFFCRSENISITGLLLETERTLAVGDRITCSFFLPGSRQLVVHGAVTRKAPPAAPGAGARYGVMFDAVPAEAKAAIESFVASRVPLARS